MLADDLAGLVPLDRLGARVPRADMASGVENEQRVVADGLDEHPELFFTGIFSQDRRAFILGLGRHAPQDSRKSTMYL